MNEYLVLVLHFHFLLHFLKAQCIELQVIFFSASGFMNSRQRVSDFGTFKVKIYIKELQ
jgi:hypothetical protein